MFKVSKVKMPYRSILSCRSKHAFILGKAYIVYCLIMGDELSLNNFFLDVPDGACGIDAWCTYHVESPLIPVKTCQWRTEFGCLINWFLEIIFVTLVNLLFNVTFLESSPTYQILRYSPDVAIKSGWLPLWMKIMVKVWQKLTWSGIHIILVGGYSCSKYEQCSKSPLSSSNFIIST